ncbi:MAG TPA: F0F1 ATP synthase subunit B [Thiopseudomonas sp.]|nr:F0F1 ATP synthase subunit B [Thiopseudomonas sp.]
MAINLTLVGQLIAFAIFAWFCMKFVWPPITNAMDERQKKIAEGLDAAGRAQRDLELAQEKATEMLRETKQAAAEIIEKANKTANEIVEEAKQNARTEGDRLIASAKTEIDIEVKRVKEELRQQVSVLAVTGAEKILGATVDAKAHNEMVEQLAAEL